MATTTKKGSKNKKAKRRRPLVNTSVAEQAQTIAELRQELETRNRDLAESLQRENTALKTLQVRDQQLAEALEHQTATSEVLSIISRSPTDVQPVLDDIVESAARVCGIDDVVLRLRDGNNLMPRAHFGSVPIGRAEVSIDEPQVHGMREHGALPVPDVRAQNDFPPFRGRLWCTYLGVPLRQQGEFIGALFARRTEVRPFTPAQIKLLETFADQAVI